MKHKIYMLLIAVSTFGIMSCVDEKDPIPDPGPGVKVYQNVFTIEGDGFAKTVLPLESDSTHTAFYAKNILSTYLTMDGENDTYNIGVDIEFTGNTTKTKTFDPANNVIITLINKNTGVGTNYTGQSGLLKVTTYGKVGEKIEGTYSGDFSNAGTGATVEITDGKFSVIRGSDQQ